VGESQTDARMTQLTIITKAGVTAVAFGARKY